MVGMPVMSAELTSGSLLTMRLPVVVRKAATNFPVSAALVTTGPVEPNWRDPMSTDASTMNVCHT